MPRTVMILNNPKLKLATTQAGLTSGTAVECQVTQARVQAQPQYNTIPATGCAGATQSPGLTGWQLALNWLQDWTAPAAQSLSAFAFANDGLTVWFELTPDSAAPTNKITGEAFGAAGDYGGTFGDGSAADATATWPLKAKPTVAGPAALATTEEGVEAEPAAADAETVTAA